MKLMLVVPTYNYSKQYPAFVSFSDFPTGYGYISSSVKKAGHEVVGLNLNNITGYKTAFYMITNEIMKAICKEKPDMVGIGGIVTDYSFIKDAISVIRKVSPKTPIVLGGGIINNDMEFIFNLLKPDYCIKGEAEETIVSLLNGEKLSEIDNLGYWEDGKAVFTKQNRNYGDIDSRPFPDYEPFGIRGMLDNYSIVTRMLYRYSRQYPRPMAILTARGCPFHCSFCVPHDNQLYRARKIEEIMREIKETYEKYQFNILIIVDELFAVNKQRMRAFCEAIIDGKEKYGWDFDWMFQTHANAELDLDTMKLAKRSGCYFFSYGLESASPTVLKSMNKKTRIPQILEAIDIADKAEVGFGGNFIFGDPAETQQTIMETLSFYFQHCRDVFVFMNLLMPYPGSALFDYCVKHGIITDKVRFYEEIEKNRFNMTSIPLEQWFMWVNYIRITEEAWLFPKTIDADWWQREDGFMFQVHATCPHCGKHTWYRQGLSEEQLTNPKLYIGPGCVHCNKKLRINMTMETRRADDCHEGREEDNRGTGICVEGGRAEKEILHARR